MHDRHAADWKRRRKAVKNHLPVFLSHHNPISQSRNDWAEQCSGQTVTLFTLYCFWHRIWCNRFSLSKSKLLSVSMLLASKFPSPWVLARLRSSNRLNPFCCSFLTRQSVVTCELDCYIDQVTIKLPASLKWSTEPYFKWLQYPRGRRHNTSRMPWNRSPFWGAPAAHWLAGCQCRASRLPSSELVKKKFVPGCEYVLPTIAQEYLNFFYPKP